MKNQFMKRAIEISLLSVEKGTGPFGAVIVKDGKIIAEGSNTVTQMLQLMEKCVLYEMRVKN